MKELKPETQAFLDRVSNFIDTEIKPNESLYQQQVEEGGRWCVPPIMEEMKAKARLRAYGISFYLDMKVTLELA